MLYGLQTIDGRGFHQDIVLFLIIHRAYVESPRSQHPVAVRYQPPALPPCLPASPLQNKKSKKFTDLDVQNPPT